MSPVFAVADKPRRPRRLSPNRKPEGMSLEEWQLRLRQEYGREQDFVLENLGDQRVFSDFAVTNPVSGNTYQVSIRGDDPGVNFCTCPDFAVNTLGTCKHVEFSLARLWKRRGAKAAFKRGYRPPFSEVWLRYGPRRQVVFSPGTDAPQELISLGCHYFDEQGTLRTEAYATFPAFLSAARAFAHEVRCLDQALEFIAQVRDAEHRRARLDAKYPKGEGLEGLLKASLYPYQREGALFAARCGRALLGDDMGLGKTVQAIAFAELMAREFGVEKVLVICPASLKYQWKHEVERFSDRSVEVVEGPASRRQDCYEGDAFIKIVNYDLIHRDLESIRKLAPDAVILDEAQRIKNWKTRTARAVKSIDSPYAMVLTGTPLENRLEELYSLVEFVDRHRLGPLFRFRDHHQVTQPDSSRVVGYRNLASLGETLKPILLRRRRSEVLAQLPERTDQNFFVPMTTEQRLQHEENREIVARIASKWRRYRFLAEADQRRLTIALQRMRMACDNSYLVDQRSREGPKLQELLLVLGELLEDPEAKVVVFSQWSRMHDLVAEQLEGTGCPFVYLHGGVPSHKRGDLIDRFRTDSQIRIFLSTDAGAVGLNLQRASTVINLDLPWNPAVLEQRIARVHRMGQQRGVRVINFVSEGTIEHGMLSVLRFKQGVFDGVLDGGEDEVFLEGSRLEQFMDTVDTAARAVPETARETEPPDLEESPQDAPLGSTPPERPSLDSALRPLLETGVAFLRHLGELVDTSQRSGQSPVASLVERDPNTGRSYLKVPVPEPEVLEGLALSLLSAFGLGAGGNGSRHGKEGNEGL